MSSLDHDRLLEEGAAPAGTATTVPTPARATTSSSAGSTSERAGAMVPPQRQGKAQPAGGRGATDPITRPTPHKRTPVDLAALEPVADAAGLAQPQMPAPASVVVVVKDAPARPAPVPAGDDIPGADPVAAVEAVARGRLRLATRRPLSVRRRPAMLLAGALVVVLSISGAAAAPPPQVATQTVSHSVSVAEQLGIESVPPAVVDEQATSRLREMVSSRTARAAERTAAADVQAEADRRATEEAARAAAEAARPKAVHPVEGARLTSGFGARWGTLHPGIDLAAPMRTPERAVMDGVVLEAGPASGFGLVVYIQHDNGDVTVYGHMDEILVEPGQLVRAGDTIALLGNRGQSTGPHLHFEVHVGGLDGEKVDPVPWLRARGIEV